MEKLTTETKKFLQFNWKIRLKLWAEGDKLRAEGDKLWAETIIEFCGNIKIKWIHRSDKNLDACKLETGDIFEP